MLLWTGCPDDLGCRMRIAALPSNKELHRSRSGNDSMNMQAVLTASIIRTDVLLHLGSTHDSSLLHMFPLNYSEYPHPMGDGWLFSLYHLLLKFSLVTINTRFAEFSQMFTMALPLGKHRNHWNKGANNPCEFLVPRSRIGMRLLRTHCSLVIKCVCRSWVVLGLLVSRVCFPWVIIEIKHPPGKEVIYFVVNWYLLIF